jgi:transcriptional regulator with XRE-family HTH domain
MMTRASLLPQFARLLKGVRLDSGLTVRQLARAIGFSHPHVVRATSGKKVPNWPLVSAYLNACGVGGEALCAWWELRRITKSVEQELHRTQRAGSDREWYWTTIEQDWTAALHAIRKPDPMLATLRSVATLDELGIAIHALVTRAGLDSVRQVELRTEIPKTTLNHWFNGTRKPTPERLQVLIGALDATDSERREFALALHRLGDVTCGTLTRGSGQPCVLGEFHKGPHRAANGEKWLDDGDLDGMRGPKQWMADSTVRTRGPHW